MAKIYYVGDWAILLGPVFAETPFNYSYKGLETYNYGAWLKEALESSGEHEVMSVPHWGCNFVYWKLYNQFWLTCLNKVL